MYAVVVYVETSQSGWTRVQGLPTFFLDEDVQGITSSLHAESIVRHMLQTIRPEKNGVSYHITVLKTD
jgi:hypothetical protein